jgi:hypothetical protein
MISRSPFCKINRRWSLSTKYIPIHFSYHDFKRHIDALLGNCRETDNETMAIAMRQLRKYATLLEPLLGSGPRTTLEVLSEAVFSVWSTPRLCHSTNRPELIRTISAVQCSGVERVGVT